MKECAFSANNDNANHKILPKVLSIQEAIQKCIICLCFDPHNTENKL